jgi:glycosyltransferase involved in cell wall biosynthesis
MLQDYPQISRTKLYVADAGSTDGTQDLVLGYSNWLNVEVIPGGRPSAGRNAGAKLANTRYVLFIDADMQLTDTTLIRRAIELMKRKQLHCLTTNISCPEGRFWDRALYAGNNFMQHFSRLGKPFSTGMFMLFDKRRFDELGGFHEQVHFAEDYLLSQKVSPRRFGIVKGKIVTTDRRFRRMSHVKLASLFLKTALNSWNQAYFLRDHHYWQSEA